MTKSLTNGGTMGEFEAAESRYEKYSHDWNLVQKKNMKQKTATLYSPSTTVGSAYFPNA
jgi:hypothetical protein